jgi:hypothetical protein
MIPETVLSSRDPAAILGWIDLSDRVLDADTAGQVKALWTVAAHATAAQAAPRSRVAVVEALDVFELRRRASEGVAGSAQASAYLKAYGLDGTAGSGEAAAFLAHAQILLGIRAAVLGMARPGAARLYDDADVAIRGRAIVPFLRGDVRLPSRAGLRNFGDLGGGTDPATSAGLAAALRDLGVLGDAIVSHVGIGQVPLAFANLPMDAATYRETHQDLGEDCQVSLAITFLDPRGAEEAPPVAVLPVSDPDTLRALHDALSRLDVDPGSAADLLAWVETGNGRSQIDQAYAKATEPDPVDALDLDFGMADPTGSDDALEAATLGPALDTMEGFLVLALESPDPGERAAHRQNAVEQSLRARDAYEAALRCSQAKAERALGILDGRRRAWSRW